MRYYFYLVFIFWDIHYKSALIAGMEAEEETFRQNFFICLRVYEQKNKINFDERSIMRLEWRLCLISPKFHFNFCYSVLNIETL